ncbi:S-layer homology domain-containing protein [Peptoniphilus stercorisuis]|uniref:SLH domain-containing protein n=1 Tax=Peptoniphilus stercorisuis TaxID=1436965 RepID=A0ABS4KC28_9FIRM|nr:S-layer homology domain-containing protein [Peptoniphilus stercorisuis]MBP2025328.1 hypothetical protein [Peptoniphilus stercorisuis]
MNKKISLILTLLFSLSSVNVYANTVSVGKPSNISVEKKDANYEITFKNSNELKKSLNKNNIKVELDVKSSNKDWSSKNSKTITKDLIEENGKGKININKEEIVSVLNEDPDNYSVRLRYSDVNNKGEFSNYVTMGTVGIYSNSSKWAENELLEAQKLGLISDDLKSDMKKEITREEFAELIVKAAEKANIAKSHIEDDNFKDTDNKYVAYAHSLNLMNGVSKDKFAPKGNLKKQDMAVSVNRLLSNTDKLKSVNKDISDIKAVSPYAVESVNNLVSNQILNLDKNNKFNPKKNITREEAVIIMLRAIK